MSQPLVTVFVPIVAWDPFSEQGLRSLAQQSYQNLEIFLISLTDEMSEEQLRAFFPERERVHFIRSKQKETRGALNEALHLGKGDFFTFLFPYDAYHPARIEICIQKMQDEEGEFLFTRMHPLNEQNSTLAYADFFWRWRQLTEFQADSLPTIGFKLVQDNIVFTLGNAIFSKRILSKLQEFREFKQHYAYDFFLRALQLAEPLFVKQELYYLRVFRNINRFTIGDEADRVRGIYLSEAETSCKNKLAPSIRNWPMSFASFRFDEGFDKCFAKQFQEMECEEKNYPAFSCSKTAEGSFSIITSELSFTSDAKIAVDLALSLKRKGFSPSMISLSDGPLKELLEREEIPCKIFNKRIWKWSSKGRIYKKVCALILIAVQLFLAGKRKTIAVNAATWPAVLVAAVLFPFRKLAWFLHDPYPPEAVLTEGVPMKLLKFCLKKANLHFWFGTKTTKKIWEAIGAKGRLLFWSGIMQQPKRASPAAVKKLLAISGHYSRQGANFLLDAFLQCIEKKQIPEDVTLTIAGFSEKLDDLQQFSSDILLKIRNPLLKERVFLFKSLSPSKLQELYQESDLFIQSSLLECNFLELFQAMANGMPIITTESELIQDGFNGYSCPRENSAQLAEKIAQAVNNPENSFKLGQRAQELFQEKYALEISEPLFLHALQSTFSEKKAQLSTQEQSC